MATWWDIHVVWVFRSSEHWGSFCAEEPRDSTGTNFILGKVLHRPALPKWGFSGEPIRDRIQFSNSMSAACLPLGLASMNEALGYLIITYLEVSL